MPDNQQFKFDAELTAIAVTYRNPDYALIADDVLPRAPVADRDFKWHEYDEAELFTQADTRVGRRSAPNRVEIGGTEQSASILDYGIDVPLDNATIRQAEKRGYNVRGRAIERAANIVLLDREVRVAAAITNPAAYHADQKLALAGASMFTSPDADPIGAIQQMVDACWMRPNQIGFGQPSWTAFRRHPKVVSAVYRNSGTSGMVTREDVARLFEVQRVLVGESRVNINKPGLAPQMARTWGPVVWGQFIDRSVTPETGGVTFGLTAELGTRVGGTINVDMGFDGGVLVRAGERVRELIVARRAGFLIQNAA
jgi:hypothetical protein